MKDPKITIGIPCYNQDSFVADALFSALEQTVKCEIIVVNDGSTDKSLEVMRSYEKEGIKVINQINKGLPSARNTLIMNMTGDYLLPLDADDMLEDTCVERMIKVIEETDADIVSPSFKCFGTTQSDVILMPNPTLEDFRTANRVPYCSAIRKDALLEVGGYSPRMLWGYEDYALWIDLLKRGKKMVTMPEKLMLYRTKEESMLTEAVKHHEELIARINFDNQDIPV